MADHCNINEARQFDRDWDVMVQDAKLKLELEWANKRIQHLVSNLDAIFTRIGRGDTAYLYYSNGNVVEIMAVPTPAKSEA